MNMIEARNITRVFPVGDGDFYALKHVDIDIPAGKLTILKGRSGSGKTTLLRCLNFLEHPDNGIIRVNGETLFDASVPETNNIFPINIIQHSYIKQHCRP